MKASVTILPEDTANYNEFVAGNPVQVRVTVKGSETGNYKKGDTVKVIYNNEEATGRIVSDPLTVSPEKEKDSRILSLIVERVGLKE